MKYQCHECCHVKRHFFIKVAAVKLWFRIWGVSLQQKDLELFLTLCETLHFAKAGELMHLSSSAVSRSVQRLEEQMSCILFERDNRHVRLTRDGQIFKRHAEQMLSNWRKLKTELQQEQKHLQGEISLYCSVTAAYSVLISIIEELRALHPGIELKLHTGDEAVAIERAAAGREDIVIAAHPEKLPQRLQFLTLTHSPLLFIQPVVNCQTESVINEIQNKGENIPWGDLPFILQEVGLARRQVDKWFNDLQIEPYIYAQVAGHEAIVSMVALGMGIGVVPELVLQSSPLANKVKVIDVQPPLRPYAVGLCVQASKLENDLVKAFWNCAKSAYLLS